MVPDRPTVEKQEADTDGLIHFIRTLAKLRVDHPALGADGEFEFLNPQGDDFPFVYKRSLDGASYLVVTNPLDREATISLSDPSASTATILDGGVTLSKGNITAPAFGYGIFKL